jgi:hypothetical protein
MSRADAGLLCDAAAVFGRTIKDTHVHFHFVIRKTRAATAAKCQYCYLLGCEAVQCGKAHRCTKKVDDVGIEFFWNVSTIPPDYTISQKTAMFMATAVRTSQLTSYVSPGRLCGF